MFRKIASLLLIMIILSTSFTTLAEDSVIVDFGDVAGKAGDVDVDTYITSADLVLLRKILLGVNEPQSVKTANVDEKDNIDVRDLVRLKKIMIEVYEDFINYRTPLTHTYKKLTEDKELNVLYFGGSVTAGYGASNGSYCWRAQSESWLKAQFPEANINAINAAIGESGTFLGTYRLQSDIIARNPDLIFIEYAINDHYKGATKEVAALQYETIVREIRTALPKTDIVTLLVTDESVVSANQLFATAAGHEEIAEYYGISTVNVGQYLWSTIGKTKANWNEYFIDIVHPTNLGYTIYYQCVEEYLRNALTEFDFRGLTDVDKTVNAQIKSAHLLDGNRQSIFGSNITDYVETTTTTGFSYNGGYFGTSGRVGFYQAKKTTADAQITFKFSGTEFAFWTNFKGGSTISYSIDGGDWVNMETHAHAPTQVVTGLNSAEHTITIKPVSYASGLETMDIHAIFTRDAALQTVK